MIRRYLHSRSTFTLAGLCASALLTGCDFGADSSNDSVADQSPAPEPGFIGSDACASCHADEHAAWLGSHHYEAMRVADENSVLGDFADARFEYNGETTTFFRSAEDYWVNTGNGDGADQDFRIAYTFGVDPLQQYLIELPGGKFQALSIAWDSRDASAGGQRWFHLYPDEAIDDEDPLHWTGTFQRWNTMCADCHSTDLVKAYDPDSDTFATTFSEINVACEACHGPGSRHVSDPATPPPVPARRERAWVFDAGASIARRVPENRDRDSLETEVCAQCHSRRSQLTDDHEPGEPFLDAYRPTLLEEGLYHADGQILDEVYVYGSFMQSAMAAAGVTCSDCHEPHSGQLRAPGNAMCSTCHLATTYDAPAHHRHTPETQAAACVSCHMRSETYMVVDPRRDHSFRVPRPDLSTRLDTPNACNDCHDDQTAEWAASRIREWYPDGRYDEFHYGEALAAGRNLTADSAALLLRVIENTSRPGIVRATALSLMARQIDDRVLEQIRAGLEDDDQLVRLTAIDLLALVPFQLRRDWGQSALTDPLLALRISAARGLVAVREELSERRASDLDESLAEYVAAQRFNSDRVEGMASLARLAADLGQMQQAEETLLTAIDRNPAASIAYAELADLYRAQGREGEATRVLEDGLSVNPDDAALRVAFALALVRAGSPDEALSEIERAVELAPDEPYYAYVQGIALNSLGDVDGALEVLRNNNERFPAHHDTLVGLATILRDRGEFESALEYATRLQEISPASAAARALIDEIEPLARQ